MIDSSPEQKYGISDPDFDKTNLLWRAEAPRGSQRFRVLAGIRDTGEANAITPVLNELSKQSFDVFILATGRGEEALGSFKPRFTTSKYFNPRLRVERMRGNIAITGLSATSSIEMALHDNAHQRGMKVFAIEDYPGSYCSYFEDTFAQNEGLKPDYLFVMNDWAKKTNLEQSSILPADRIIALGAPALDAIAHTDKSKTRDEVRNLLGVKPEETLILWCGQVAGATVESLDVFLKGLNILKPEPYRLAVRFHPMDTTPKETYDHLLESFKDKYINAGRAVVSEANRVIAASDLVVQERSTVAMQSAAWGVPVISIAIDEINEKYGVMLGLKVPVIEDGTSPVITRKEDMAEVLEKVLFNQEFRSQLDTKMQAWKSDGRAAERVAHKIIELTSN
ncbi:MAG: CDP-glycerol glycerophosphotransferase family protein [Candidatus Daviesbacteria bacterium]